MLIAAICAFGYRFLADELERKGMAIGERRIWRLCSQAALWSSFVKKSRSSKRPGPAVHDDLVLGNFSPDKANQLSLH
jgi:putative transposase